MAIDVTKLVAGLEAEYLDLLAKRAALPAMGFSLDGLSVDPNAARKSIDDRLKLIQGELAGLGFPIGTLSQPFQVFGRLRG